jgi:hypothetical protein
MAQISHPNVLVVYDAGGYASRLRRGSGVPFLGHAHARDVGTLGVNSAQFNLRKELAFRRGQVL